LRYKHDDTSRITVNKLQNITVKKDNTVNIIANQIKLLDNLHNKHCINQLTSIINTITMTNSYGSSIEDFFISDNVNTKYL
jgi:hypothetical protein